MAKDRQPIAKRCKALGITPASIGYSAKKETTRNSGNKSRKKQSEYATQLQEKQKVKFIYGVLEKQFRGYYDKAVRMPGKSGDNLLILLERRLDNVVYRLGLANTRREARQFVTHGHMLINGKKASIPSMLVRPNDVITVKEKSQSIERIKAVREEGSTSAVPKWLDMDYSKLTAKVTAYPQREDIDMNIEEQLIVELYSR